MGSAVTNQYAPTAHDGKDRDDDERLGDMTLVLVIGVLVGMHLALGFLSIVMQGNGRGNIDLGDTEILIESRQHAGLVRIGGVRKHRGCEAGACGTSVSICSCVRRGKPAVRPAARSDAAASSERIPGAGRPHLGHVRSCGERRAPQPSQNTNSVCSGPSPGPHRRCSRAERGAVLDSLKAMRADHGILFSKQFKQSRLEHNIATAPQEQGTNQHRQGA